MSLPHHALLAGLVSFGLSGVFGLAFGVFMLIPFFVVSSACAIVGALIGWVAGKRLWVTALAAALIRVGVFVAVIGPS